MSRSDRPLAPELPEILREVADDPDSSLMRAEPREPSRSLLEPRPETGVHAAFLTKAERHLLEAYREQTAWLLVRVCEYLAASDPVHRGVLYRPKSAEEVLPIPERRAVEERASALRDVELADNACADAIDLAFRCLARERPRVTLGEVADASMRIGPSDQARFYGCLHLINESKLGAAKRVQARLLVQPVNSSVRQCGLELKGLLAYRERDYGAAANGYRRAFRVDESGTATALYWLVNSHWAGDRHEVVAASAIVDDHLPPGCQAIVDMIGLLDEEKRVGRAPTMGVDRRVFGRLGAASREVLNAAS